MPANLLKLIAPAVIVAGAALFLVSLPQERSEEPAVPVDPSPPHVNIVSGQTIAQTFQGTGQPIAGFSVFSPAEKVSNYTLRASIVDQETGKRLSTTQISRSQYHNGSLVLFFDLKPVATVVKQPLRLTLTNIGVTSVELMANADNSFTNGQLEDHALAAPSTDLSFALIHPAPTSAATKQGVMAGLVILLGSVVIALLPRRRFLAAALLLAISIPLATSGFWFSTGALGMSDWDLFAPMHEGYRQTVLTYHEFPWWNPYTFGGVAGLADPEFAVLSFNFAYELVFGVVTGFRLSIYTTLVITALGMLVLGRRLGLSVHAALLAALIVPLSSATLLRFVEGHIQYFALSWIPWIFWSWYCAYQHAKAQGPPHRQKALTMPVSMAKQVHSRLVTANGWALLCGVFLSLAFYQGGIYPLFYTLPALIAFMWVANNTYAAWRVTLTAGLWSFALSAFKLLPVINWLQEYPDDFYHVSSFALPYWNNLYLGRNLHGAQILPNQSGGWHEYGAYIGIVVFALAVLSLSRAKSNRLIRLLLLGFIVAALIASAGPALVPLFDVLTFLPRSNIIRLGIFSVFTIALLAGFGLHLLQQHSSKIGRYLAPALVGLAALELTTLAYPLSEQAFTVPPVTPQIVHAPAPIAFSSDTNTIRVNGTDETRTYESVVAGYGTLPYRPNTAPPQTAIPLSLDGGDYITSSEAGATTKLISWSPNQTVLEVNTPSSTIVSLNGNYARDWRVNGQRAQKFKGRVSASVEAGTHILTFKYRPSNYLLGLIISVTALVLAIWQTTILVWARRSNTAGV